MPMPVIEICTDCLIVSQYGSNDSSVNYEHMPVEAIVSALKSWGVLTRIGTEGVYGSTPCPVCRRPLAGARYPVSTNF